MMSSIRWGLCAGFLASAIYLGSGCSTGPQLPVTTPVVNVSCTWNAELARVEDNDCLIDRASAEGRSRTTGNETGDVSVSPETHVSGTR